MNLGIVIGVEKYKIDLYDDLKACKNDAKIFKDVLGKVRISRSFLPKLTR